MDPKKSERSPPVRQFDFAKTLYPQLPNEDANGNLVLAVDDAEEKQEENVMVGFNWHLLGIPITNSQMSSGCCKGQPQ